LANWDPLEIYNRLTGGLEAPPALIEAQRRVDQARPERPATEAPLEVVPPSDPSSRSSSTFPTPSPAPEAPIPNALPIGSGDWFRAHYCLWSSNFCDCFLYRTGDGTVIQDDTIMDSAAYAYRGNITQQLEYWDCVLFSCDWRNNITQTVYEG